MLRSGFRKVQMHPQTGFSRPIRHLCHCFRSRCVFRMDRQINPDPPIVRVMELPDQRERLPVSGQIFQVTFIKTGDRRTEIDLDAAFERSAADRVLAEIHVGHRRDPKPEQLGDRQHRAIVDILRGEQGLKREHPGVQPVVERKVFRITAQQGHCRVAVGVDQPRHQQFALAVVPLAVVLLGRLRPDIFDFFAAHPQKLVFAILAPLIQQANPGKEHGRPSF